MLGHFLDLWTRWSLWKNNRRLLGHFWASYWPSSHREKFRGQWFRVLLADFPARHHECSFGSEYLARKSDAVSELFTVTSSPKVGLKSPWLSHSPARIKQCRLLGVTGTKLSPTVHPGRQSSFELTCSWTAFVGAQTYCGWVFRAVWANFPVTLSWEEFRATIKGHLAGCFVETITEKATCHGDEQWSFLSDFAQTRGREHLTV